MKIKRFSRLILFGLGLGLISCTGGETDMSAGLFRARKMDSVSFISSDPTLSLRWPEFLLAGRGDRYLWGEGRQVLEIEAPTNGPVVARSESSHFTGGLSKLIAAARSPEGMLAVLDVSGRVAAYKPTGQRWQFETHLANEPGALAVAKDRIYLLLQGTSRTGSAVAAYTPAGVEIGEWGEMPADGVIQANLRGGGIAACPDGSVFYTYINSPLIFSLQSGEEKHVRALGKQNGTFQVISKSRIFRAAEDGMRSGSPEPLVKLGLGASRVMSLLCSSDGLLFRQVAMPAGRGSYIEVWDPASSALRGTIPKIEGVLMDVRGHTLYLGTSKDSRFILDRVDFRLDPFQPERGTV